MVYLDFLHYAVIYVICYMLYAVCHDISGALITPETSFELNRCSTISRLQIEPLKLMAKKINSKIPSSFSSIEKKK